MNAEYEITKEDLGAFNLYHHCHSPTARRAYYRAWFGGAIVWLLVCLGIWYLADKERGTPLQTFLDLLPLFSGVPVWLLYFPWAYRRKLRKIVSGMLNEGKNRNVFGQHRVSISPEGIMESGEDGQISTGWKAVERVVKTGDYAYVYVNALAAIIVPRRAFASEAQFDEFVTTATTYREHAAA